MTPDPIRTDRHVRSEPGFEVRVREVRPARPIEPAVLLVHGGGPGGVASFDLPVPGYSLAETLARRHVVYAMDVRGWGGSTRPAALEMPASENPPAVSSEEAVRDIAAVVDAVDERIGRVALVGWATGGHWSAMYASRRPARVSHLVILNSLYGLDARWGMRAGFEADDRPGEFDRAIGAYALRSGASLLGGWDRSIPAEDKREWRDERVAAAYVTEALASDPESERQSPPAVRIPTGFQRDSYEMSRGRRFWDASDIRVPTLVIRGELDFWSRPEDVAALERELTSAPRVRTVTIPEGTHYLFVDRPERGRAHFVEEVERWLDGSGD